MNNAAVQQFTKLINEKYGQVKELYQILIYQLVSEDKDSKVDSTEEFLNACISLKENLPSTDSPVWLRTIISEGNQFLNNHKNINNWINVLLRNYESITNHNWNFNQEAKAIYDLDEIYFSIKSETNVDRCFENLINQLKQIIESNQIDSKTISESLEQLLSILKQNRTSSYLGLRGTLEFSIRFLGNSAWSAVKSIPGIKHFVKGFEDSVEQMKLEDKKISSLIKNALVEKFNSSLDKYPEKEKYLIEEKVDSESKE